MGAAGAGGQRTVSDSLLRSRTVSYVFVKPRFDQPVDVEGHLARLPANATCKGMFFRDLIALATSHVSEQELLASAGIPARRYLAFLDYPMHDNLKLTVAVAKVVHPHVPLAEGLRRLGRTGYQTFLASHVGKVLILAVSHDVAAVLELAPRAYPLIMNFGEVSTERPGPRTVIARCRSFPAFVATYQVGTIEAVFEQLRVDGQVRVCVEDIANVAIEASW